MDRRIALVALWAAFAAAAVGVGFGAAGLVGDPFTDGVTDAVPAADAPSDSLSGSPSGSTTSSPSPSSPSGAPSGTSATSSPSRSGTAGPASQPVTRTLTTRAGLASATCRAGSVRLSASPAVGWQIEDIDPGPDHQARVRFEPTGDGDGRVEVRATCSSGVPRFSLDDDRSGHGGGDSGGDSSGSDDSGG